VYIEVKQEYQVSAGFLFRETGKKIWKLIKATSILCRISENSLE
jgi:hypothetical protein